MSYDAIVVGSGPNGLSAAIILQKAGLSVLLIEGKEQLGGGMRTAVLTLPGFQHDVCSAIHPMAIHSPFFSTLPLENFGLKYIIPPLFVAHPFDNGKAAVLCPSITESAATLGKDKQSYLDLIAPVVNDWSYIINDILGPLSFPKQPVKLARFGLNALRSASAIAKRFVTNEARGFWAGMAAHSMQPLTHLTTAAIGLVLAAAGHIKGWPIPEGGSQSMTNALAAYFISLGGKIETGRMVNSIDTLLPARIILFDLTPKQLTAIAGTRFSNFYKWQLNRYKYGVGVFKIDWALKEPIPFSATACRSAATIHLGGNFETIAFSEQQTFKGKHVADPFVLLTQPSIFDKSRAPNGKHTAWAYCHVPNGSIVNMTSAIENQVERFAPGFKDLILAKHSMNTSQMETYNPNYVGGDINGGMINITQLFTRPALRISPYRTSTKGIYICSSATPPAGGVHGMCGYHAAKTALKDIFNIIV